MRCITLVLVAIAQNSLSIPQPRSASAQCLGDICDIPPEKCLVEPSIRTLCRALTYPALYKTRGEPAELWVNISNFNTYPENLAFTVAQVYNQSWTTVEGCCNLKINSSCLLPPAEGDYYIFVPVVKRRQAYCHYKLDELPGLHPDWCYDNPKPPCIFLDRGVVSVNDTYKPLSTRDWPTRYQTDHCFFYAPSIYAKRGRVSPYGLTRQVEGIRLEHGKVLGDGIEEDCVVVEGDPNFNLSFYLTSNNTRQGYTMCGFTRIKRYDREWDEQAICLSEGYPVQKRLDWIVIGATCAALVVILLSLIALALVYKRYVKFCFPSYKSSIRESGVIQADIMRTPDDENKIFDAQTSDYKTNKVPSGNGQLRSGKSNLYVLSSSNRADVPANIMEKEVSVIVPDLSTQRTIDAPESPEIKQNGKLVETETRDVSEGGTQLPVRLEHDAYAKKEDIDLIFLENSQSAENGGSEGHIHPEKINRPSDLPFIFLNDDGGPSYDEYSTKEKSVSPIKEYVRYVAKDNPAVSPDSDIL